MAGIRRSVATLTAGGAVALLLLISLPISADEMEVGEYAEEDMIDCLDCHDEESKYPVLSILATQHAVKADSRTPLAQTHECQTCHGGAAAHIEDEDVLPNIRFGAEHPAGPQNAMCLECHQGGNRINWQGSPHATSEVACASCHKVHVHEDPVMVRARKVDTPVHRDGQAQVCFTCHVEKRADIHKVSSHPIRDGIMVCTDCHNTHGSLGASNLVRPTVNETCFQCHAEKRGPFLWEHAPATESCTTCHTPHGSNHFSLLVARQPQLCQQCHIAQFHPSTNYQGPDYSAPFPGGTPIGQRQAFAKGCLNCHPEVHGTNHPSGPRWTR
jgi:DmsE family decaheme c-type cytochrome